MLRLIQLTEGFKSHVIDTDYPFLRIGAAVRGILGGLTPFP
jgi:hypothetical protein